MRCGSTSTNTRGGPSQQKQFTFQYEQKPSCKPNAYKPASQIPLKYDLQLDCDSQKIVVRYQGIDLNQAVIPIQESGKIFGQMRYQQQVIQTSSTTTCWLEHEVVFEGTAHCSSRNERNPTDHLSLKTTVNLNKISNAELRQFETEGPLIQPSFSPSTSPIPSVSVPDSPWPSPSPSLSPLQLPSPIPLPTTSPTYSPGPSPYPTRILS